jgi:hypothetical protein
VTRAICDVGVWGAGVVKDLQKKTMRGTSVAFSLDFMISCSRSRFCNSRDEMKLFVRYLNSRGK